ncbi:MAG: acyloxyacyl hydrolase [Chromatiaceae bacterium]|jgi:hypothetical protein
MMRLMLSLAMLCLVDRAAADEQRHPRYVGVRMGQSFSAKSNINAYAATWRHGWLAPRPLGQGWQWRLDVEYALAEWQTDVPDGRNVNSGREETLVASISPVFRFSAVEPLVGGAVPFVEAGIGASYFQHKKIAAHDMSEGDLGSHLQFEDRVSIGLSFPRLRDTTVTMSVFHYSNANLGDANDGINLRVLSVQIPL